MRFYEFFLGYMRRNRVSVLDLILRSGVPKRTVVGIFRGRKLMSGVDYQRFCDAMGVELSDALEKWIKLSKNARAKE